MYKELLEQRAKAMIYDDWENHFAKIKGTPEPGQKLEVHWTDKEDVDEGYFFTLPEMEIEENDLFIHIPKPDNSSGIGDAPDIHIHLLELASFELVKKINCI